MDKNAEHIINMLNLSGYEAYAVGGAVRDMILNRTSDDWDITTSATPDQTKKVFSEYSLIETGIKHGTVGVVIDKKVYEVTTYRTENDYTDSRHPDSVTFVRDLEADLARRDFTVNAIAYSKEKGFVDPFGGISDIERGIIRTVGNPFDRFSEDALRILRAIRFSSVLGFEIEENTSSALFKLSNTLNKVSPERIFTELKKLLMGKNAQTVIDKYSNVLKCIVPINGITQNISKLPLDFSMRLTCLCSETVIEALEFLRADNKTKHECLVMVNSTPMPDDRVALKRYISNLGRKDATLVTTYRRALYGEDKNNVSGKLLTSDECMFISDLAVDGNDVSKLGFKGKSIGEVLDKLLDCVIEGKAENNKESLLAIAKNIDNQQ